MSESKEYLSGAYDMCRLLLTSPRMHKPQREVIEEQGYAILAKLEALDRKESRPT